MNKKINSFTKIIFLVPTLLMSFMAMLGHRYEIEMYFHLALIYISLIAYRIVFKQEN